jgi:hypothetical protein
MPPGSESERVHVDVLQVQPVPDMPVMVRPTGGVSVIVTCPLVAATLVLLMLTVYWTPVCPCEKLPTWLLLIVSVGTVVTDPVAMKRITPVGVLHAGAAQSASWPVTTDVPPAPVSGVVKNMEKPGSPV